MKTITTNLYTITELKEQFPEGFKAAHRHWVDNNHEIFWQDETIDSLKACVEKAGIELRDWSLGAYNRGNHISIEFPQDGTGELSGPRAMAWLENNLLGKLRVKGNSRVDDWRKYKDPATGLLKKDAPLDKTARYYRTFDGTLHKRDGRVGEISSCPLTGYCSDEDYLDHLRKAVAKGETLKEAFEGLADVCQELLEQECEDQATEEYFIQHAEGNDFEFEDNGTRH